MKRELVEVGYRGKKGEVIKNKDLLHSTKEFEIAYDSSFARNQKAKMGIIYALQKPGKPNKYMLVFLDKKNKIIRHVKTYSSENDAKKDMTVLEKKLREAEKHWAKHGDMRGFKA